MRIAVLLTSDKAKFEPKDFLPKDCTEILTDTPLIVKYADDHGIACKELPLSDAIENADYVIILYGKNSSKLASASAKCRKFNKSFEIVMID